jgi:hypothetical protein
LPHPNVLLKLITQSGKGLNTPLLKVDETESCSIRITSGLRLATTLNRESLLKLGLGLCLTPIIITSVIGTS